MPELDDLGADAMSEVQTKAKAAYEKSTDYAGENKKAVFTILNWLLPEKGVLPMHCSANHAPGDPDDAAELAARLRAWRGSIHIHRDAAHALSTELRSRTWDDMARLMTTIILEALP